METTEIPVAEAAAPDQVMMFVRYIGTKVCFTIMDGSERFYMAEPEECNDAERQIADNGGGELPLSIAIAVVAS